MLSNVGEGDILCKTYRAKHTVIWLHTKQLIIKKCNGMLFDKCAFEIVSSAHLCNYNNNYVIILNK